MFDLHRSTHHTVRRTGLALALIGWICSTALPVLSQTDPGSSSLTQAGLTLEQRINYQRAIEEVYWRHRIWPQQNAAPKPALEEIMPLSTLRAKVEDYLRKSQALEVNWQRPITAAQLQAEMDRMARQTKQPGVLKELWAALGNDPYVIAECLARPSLANRLIRNWYAHDERYHGALKSQAKADLQAYGTASQMRQMSGEYREVEWVTTPHPQPLSRRGGRGESLFGLSALSTSGREGGPQGPGEGAQNVVLNTEEWATKVHELAQLFGRPAVAAIYDRRPGVGSEWLPGTPPLQGAELDLLPVGELSPLQEDDERFYVTAVLDKGADQVKLATVDWKKQPFDAWWKGQAAFLRDAAHGGPVSPVLVGTGLAAPEQDPTYEYRLASIKSGSDTCVDDTWALTLTPFPRERFNHTAVWTGSEMIVWGGYNSVSFTLNTGARYDPATDSWTATTTTNAPSTRYSHTAVWTGTEMIVWGGGPGPPGRDTGGRYDPATDSWTPTAMNNAPSARYLHTAVWIGSEMIVWGGNNFAVSFNTGGRYDPATDTWTATATTNGPSPRWKHTAVWTGSEMIVWGGMSEDLELRSGGRYDPLTDSWAATAMDTAPSARSEHTAVWTGGEMIVWGGNGSTYLKTGGRYDPAADSWTDTTTTNAPRGRVSHTAVWTGSEMIVWGGFDGADTRINTGGRYDPETDTWTATTTTIAPSGRVGHTAVWTGSVMIVWGGFDGKLLLNNGARYDPATDSWTPTTINNIPSGRVSHTAVWTGSEMIVWGGSTFGIIFDEGGRYDPATDTWTPTTTDNAPSSRGSHTAVWTGSEMILWGGKGYVSSTNSGGRYNPATDTWTPTATDDAPSARYLHTAVWTGSVMIAWGGMYCTNGDDCYYLDTGGRYDPATDSWTAMTTTNAPSARIHHTAVWTGSEMIVWGAETNNSGGRYDPAADTWTPTDREFAPSTRSGHTAVWTGSEMIVWGGRVDAGIFIYFNTGGRYDPATDRWTATSTTNAPISRFAQTAVWTGSAMIVFGGEACHYDDGQFICNYFNTGGRYDPATDGWTATTSINAPSPRSGHTAVWTGSEMIVWGRLYSYPSGILDTGGRYCASVGTLAAPRPFQ